MDMDVNTCLEHLFYERNPFHTLRLDAMENDLGRKMGNTSKI